MQGDIDFFIRVIFFSSVATFWVLYRIPTKSAVRQGSFFVFAALSGVLSGLYFLEQSAITSLSAGAGGPFAILTALCAFLAVSLIVYTADLYINIGELRSDKAYNIYGDAGLAGVTALTAATAFFCLLIPWYLTDPTIFETRSTIRYAIGAASVSDLQMLDLFFFSLDQMAKAVLFDVGEVYRFGLTNLSNNPEHLAFSTACLIYRTLVAVYVTVIAYRLIFARS